MSVPPITRFDRARCGCGFSHMNDILRSRPVNQPVLFQRLRWRLLRNSAATVMAGSQARLITILTCSLLVWLGVFAAGAWGFLNLQEHHLPPTGGIVGILFGLLFFALAVMLVFS